MTNTPEKTPEIDETLDILVPDKRFTINGEPITMREMRFGDLMRFGEEIHTVAQAFTQMTDAELNGPEGIDRLMHSLMQHQWAVLPMTAECCGKPKEWIEALSLNDGMDLMLLWWMTNKDFFIQRRARKQLAELQAAQAQAGDTSSPSSSAPATTSESLSTTPPAS